MEAYCIKCKGKQEIKNAEQVTMKNGRPAMTGVCAACGTKVYKILPAAEAGKKACGCKKKK